MMNIGNGINVDDSAVLDYIGYLENDQRKAGTVIETARELYNSARLDDKSGMYFVDYTTLERLAQRVADYDRVDAK